MFAQSIFIEYSNYLYIFDGYIVLRNLNGEHTHYKLRRKTQAWQKSHDALVLVIQHSYATIRWNFHSNVRTDSNFYSKTGLIRFQNIFKNSVPLTMTFVFFLKKYRRNVFDLFYKCQYYIELNEMSNNSYTWLPCIPCLSNYSKSNLILGSFDGSNSEMPKSIRFLDEDEKTHSGYPNNMY